MNKNLWTAACVRRPRPRAASNRWQAERFWGNLARVLIYASVLLNIWLWLRDLDTFIAIYMLAIGLWFRLIGEQAGRRSDALRLLDWAEETDSKLADAENPWRLKA